MAQYDFAESCAKTLYNLDGSSGASAACDGQILVMEDMLGLSPRVPKFVKEFG